MFIIYSDYELMIKSAEIFKQRLERINIPIVAMQLIPLNDDEMGKLVERVKFLLPNGGVIVQFLYGSTLSSFYKAMYDKNIKPPLYYIASTYTESDQMQGETAKYMEGHLFWLYDWPLDNELSKNFKSSLSSFFSYRTELNAIMIHVYISMYLWKAAVEKAGSFESVDNVRKAMYDIKIESPIGEVTVFENNHISNSMVSGTVKCTAANVCSFSQTTPSYFSLRPDPFDAPGQAEVKICNFKTITVTSTFHEEFDGSNKIHFNMDTGITVTRLLKIGFVVALTGKDRKRDIYMLNMLMAATLYAKANLGIQFDVLLYDTESSEEKTEIVGDQILSDPSLLFLFGCGDSKCRKIIKNKITGTNKLLIYPMEYEGQECSKNILYTGLIPNQFVSLFMDYASSTSIAKRYAIIRDQSSENILLSDIFKNAASGIITMVDEVIITHESTLQVEKLDRILLALKDGGFVIACLPIKAFHTLLLQLSIKKVDRSNVLIFSTLNYVDIMSLPLEYRSDIVIPSTFMISKTEKYLLFQNVLEHYSGTSDYNSVTENSWLGIAIFLEGITKMPSPYSLEAFLKNLYDYKYPFNDYNITLQSNHHIARAIFLLKFNPNGTYESVYFSTEVKPLPWNWNLPEFYGKICDYNDPLIGESKERQVITILLAISLSGDESMANRGIMDSINAFILKQNSRNGLLEKELVLSTIDIKSDSTYCTSTLLAQLNSDVNISAIFSTGFQECRLGILSKLIEKDILYFNVGFSVGEECNKEIFHFSIDPSALSYIIDQYFYSSTDGYALISSTQSYSISYLTFAQKYFEYKKRTILYSASISSSTTEIDSAVLTVFNTLPKGTNIFFFSTDHIQVLFSNALAKLTSDDDYFNIISFMSSTEASRNGATNFISISTFFAGIDLPSNKGFISQLGESVARNGVNQFMYISWVAVSIWVQAVEAKSVLTSSVLQEYIHATTFQGPLGEVKITNQNFASRSVYRNKCYTSKGCSVDIPEKLIVSLIVTIYKPLVNDALYQCDLLNSAVGSKKLEYSITIGILAPLSGKWRYRGTSMVDSLLSTIADVNNQNGLLSNSILVSIYDSKSTIEEFATSATALLKQDNIKAIFGGVEMEEINAVSLEISRSNKLWFYPGVPPDNECYSNIVFGGLLSYQITYFLLYNYLSDRQPLIILTSDDITSTYYSNSIRSAVQKLDIKHLLLNLKEKDTFTDKTKEFLPDGGRIINCIRHEDNSEIITYLKSLSTTKYQIYHLLVDEYDVFTMEKGIFNNHYYINNFGEAVNQANPSLKVTSDATQFYNDIHGKYGNMKINGIVETAYSLFHIWIVSVQRVYSYDTQTLAELLTFVKTLGPSGIFEMSQNSHAVRRVFLMKFTDTGSELISASLGAIKPLVFNQFLEENIGYVCDSRKNGNGKKYRSPEIFIGAVFGLTLIDIEIWKSLSYGVDELNKEGGVLGKQLLLKYSFEEEGSTEFMNAAKAMADDKEVVSFFACYNVNCKNTIQSLFEAKKKLFFYPGPVESEACSNYVVNSGITANQRMEAAIKYFDNRNIKGAIIVYEQVGM